MMKHLGFSLLSFLGSCFVSCLCHGGEISPYRPFPIDGGGAIQCLAVSPRDPNLVLAGVDVAGIARSTNGGMTWTMSNVGLEIKSDFAVADVAFGGGRSTVAYAAVGNTWGAKEGDSQSSVMRSEDDGLSWKRVSTAVSCGGHITRQRGKILVVDPANENHLWIGTTIQGVLESKDGGRSWRKSGPELAGYIMAMVSDPEEAARFYVGAVSVGDRKPGLWISGDRGRSWTKKLDVPITDIAVGRHGIGLAVANGNVFMTQDHGATWQRHEKGLPADRDWSCATGVDPFERGRFILAAETSAPSPFSHPKIFRLNSPGDSWVPMDTDVAKMFTPYGRPGKDGWHGFANWLGAGASGVFFHPTVKGRVFLTDWYGVNVSSDGGSTWKACYKGLCDTVPQRLLWDQADPGHVYLGLVDVGFMEGRIAPDGVLTAHSLRDVVPGTHASPWQFRFGKDVVTLVGMAEYAPPTNRIYRRVGLGKWELVFDNHNRGTRRQECNYDIPLSANEQTGEIFGVLTTGEVIRSRDGGKTWNRYKDDLLTIARQDQYKVAIAYDGRWIAYVDGVSYSAKVPGQWKREAIPDFIVCPVNSKIVYRLRRERPQKAADELLKSTDGGRTWQSIFQYPWGQSCNVALTRSEEVLYAYWTVWEGPGIAVSTDGGKTWKTLPRPPGYGLGGIWPDPANPRRAALGVHSMGFWLMEVLD